MLRMLKKCITIKIGFSRINIVYFNTRVDQLNIKFKNKVKYLILSMHMYNVSFH